MDHSKHRGNGYSMKQFFYRLMIPVTGVVGPWIFVLVSRIVALVYFVAIPSRTSNSVRFYQVLYPEKSTLSHVILSWKQYCAFTRIFLDRFLLLEHNRIQQRSLGWEGLESAIKKGEGGIILMSHMGNWEIAAHFLKKRNQDIRLLLYLGIKHKEQLEKLQKESIEEQGIKIIAVEKDEGSPFLLIEAIKWMNSGGIVSLTGDIIWSRDQKTLPVDFLGHKAHLPETPHMLALLSGKPLFILFSFPEGRYRYRIEVSEAIYVKADKRSERKQAVMESAQAYADLLEQAVRQHPEQWFHFEPFLQVRSE